ncbi:MAG: phosphatidylserine decarboxylase [Bdellovibrionales bacterium RIFOXYD12_FULL_39_22]|nr:MAG: phosphatidylserine decarboxylase [Bdellovibrionales bacterium RIFOXYB1_FULL_39_21]OFZ41980.1 MAG: phosphatidylserine decarboxylase [Bdellovibrionales bacterium RIFOXYC12_FULL_39_17]OFZ50696.1 MAG: phosphatidylserine decarboxylase [Bdellovibrionales bacterium RIFOXYC1_FULL_39_130]OFZ76444.1 MAG: phosphatidylserine decarboxylase [Bdellovibrionales bacterium RIFOXYC2_FULL_39_8]OFZ77919.1 MAG: phosphatidylserine decarboxylase [Bdellovibrionales bacterium RIFOXYD1_FULL_39_84]OFZ93645.1 MAG:
MEIKIYNRREKKIEVEKVLGGKAISWLYGNNYGRFVEKGLAFSFISKIFGLLQEQGSSKKKIVQFIKDYSIKIDDFEEEEYQNFNQFFIRKYRPGIRDFVQTKNLMPAFCEARYFGYRRIFPDVKMPVKGIFLSAKALVDNEKWFNFFTDGPLMIARLCPVDYHRFHFPDDCKILDSYRIHGKFHSVNPVALAANGKVFLENERQVTILESDNFGKLAFIEVGAMCVGKIVQTYAAGQAKFKRGAEKGYFLFGGSTVIILGEKDRWIPANDILENSEKGIEVLVPLGDVVASQI